MDWMFLSDLKYSLRMLRRAPFATLACVLTLAIGIGANVAIFSILKTVLLKPLSFPEFDRLVAVPQFDLRNEAAEATSIPDLVAYERGVDNFQSLV